MTVVPGAPRQALVARTAGLQEARACVKALPESASAAERLAALSVEAAAEAQVVTGLKPVRFAALW